MNENFDRKIIFYDGDCGFCNRSVQFALNHEKNQEIYFCALQSNFSSEFFRLKKLPPADLSTFYFWDGEKLYQKSSGALRLLSFIRFPYRLLAVFKLIPKFIRDYVYDMIAKRRHQLSAGFCMLPTLEQRKRFIND